MSCSNLTRLNSLHLRELKRGTFILKHKDLKDVENIGQGKLTHFYHQPCIYHVTSGEFGVMYRGRLTLPNRKSQVVAVKTLKG